MRLYESLSYLNNNNNHNDNIDRVSCNNGNGGVSRYTNGNSSGNTVKTFTSNGNQQSNIDSLTFTAAKTATNNSYFEFDNSLDGDALNAQQNWQLETEFTKALSALNETYCFYGSHRILKSREHLNADDDNANGNVEGDVNTIQSNAADKIDLIDESSSDIEAEINRLINRSNLCRQNFECESYKSVAPNEDQLMDEEGELISNTIRLSIKENWLFLQYFFPFSFAEEFSSLSISASLSAEKPSYPRGIINPNYPGLYIWSEVNSHSIDNEVFFQVSNI